MKNKNANLDDMIEIIREKLDSGGSVTFTPSGKSMEPMLRDGEDIVVLKKPSGRLRFLDVALYQRDNGKYVLHRVVDFGKDGSYIFCGDNQLALERGIKDDNIIAVMTAFYRKGKAYRINTLRYRLYSRLWYSLKPARRGVSFGKRTLHRFIGYFGAALREKSKKGEKR